MDVQILQQELVELVEEEMVVKFLALHLEDKEELQTQEVELEVELEQAASSAADRAAARVSGAGIFDMG